jgi:F-type H+-transporting ATPase subunit delta
MNQGIISIRYAKAMMSAGVDSHCLDELKTDMELISATIRENQLFRQILDNPVFKPQQKRKVMGELFEKRIHPLTLNLINLIIRNRRDTLLADVARNFIDLYEKIKGIKRAHVVSVTDMDETAKRQLQQQLNVLFKADLQMTAETNPNLLGGFILRVGDQQYDASLSSALKRMKKTLSV